MLNLLAATIFLPQPPMTIEQLTEAHVTALGGREKIYAIRSYVRHGWYQEGDHKGAGDIYKMRPFYRVIGNPTDPMDGIHEGFDGSAWEFYPDPGLVVRTVGQAARATRHGAMFDDPLVDPGKWGTKLVLGGFETIQKKRVYVVHATFMDGFKSDIFVDPDTYLIFGSAAEAPMHAFGKKYKLLNLWSDYRPEAGVMMQHRESEVDSETGKVLTDSGVNSVEINVDLPLSMFSPPEWQRTPVQAMIQKIYDERDEPESVISTYTWFKAFVLPKETFTGDAVDFAGYQCLKMGHGKTAVRLLELNVRDNPESPRAHFGLGRALETDGDRKRAIEEYRQALVIDPQYKRAKDALVRLGVGS